MIVLILRLVILIFVLTFTVWGILPVPLILVAPGRPFLPHIVFIFLLLLPSMGGNLSVHLLLDAVLYISVQLILRELTVLSLHSSGVSLKEGVVL